MIWSWHYLAKLPHANAPLRARQTHLCWRQAPTDCGNCRLPLPIVPEASEALCEKNLPYQARRLSDVSYVIHPTGRCINQLLLLMPKMPLARKNHGGARAIDRVNRLLISYGATGLNDRAHPRFQKQFRSIGEGKKGITGG